MKYLFLVAAVLSETIGTSALQASNQFTKFSPSVTVVISYALAHMHWHFIFINNIKIHPSWYRLCTLGWFGNNLYYNSRISRVWAKTRQCCDRWTYNDHFGNCGNSPFFLNILTLTGGISIKINIGGPKIWNRLPK